VPRSHLSRQVFEYVEASLVDVKRTEKRERFLGLILPTIFEIVGVQLFALDFAALQHVLGQRAENGFFSDLETERLHLADQAPLAGALPRPRGPPGAVFPAERVTCDGDTGFSALVPDRIDTARLPPDRVAVNGFFSLEVQ
jgi:hypothetical protein